MSIRSALLRPGRAPGTMVFDPDAEPSEITVFGFNGKDLSEARIEDPAELSEWVGQWDVVWVDMIGVGRGHGMTAISELFNLHPLALEDAVSMGQRAKAELFDEHVFVVSRMAFPDRASTEQLSLFLGEGWVLTIQETEGDCFDGVRERLREAGRRIRTSNADYLAYALIDAVVDSYFPTIEAIGDQLEELEETVFGDAGEETAAELHSARRRLQALRKAIVPHRDALQFLSRDTLPLITEETRIFLRDVYDHVLRAADTVETQKEHAGDLMSIYLTVISNRMNEIMKVLTIIASIFIPLSFIAGLYGMNFDPSVSRWNMPELAWPYGYPFALGLMAFVAGGFVVYMWRRGWLK